MTDNVKKRPEFKKIQPLKHRNLKKKNRTP